MLVECKACFALISKLLRPVQSKLCTPVAMPPSLQQERVKLSASLYWLLILTLASQPDLPVHSPSFSVNFTNGM